jgi:hypothetical protein
MSVDVQTYREEGAVIARGLVPVPLLDAILGEGCELFRVQLSSLGVAPVAGASSSESLLFDLMQLLLEVDVSAYLATVRHLAKLCSVQELFGIAPVKGALDALGLRLTAVATTPVIHAVSDRLRIPGGYHGIVPHQDWPSVQGGLKCVVVWIPLTEARSPNFPLEVVPRSHLDGIWEGDIKPHAFEILPERLAGVEFVPLQVDRGDAVFMSSFTVHRTGLAVAGEECRGFRLSFSLRFEDSTETAFAARGYPCAYKRVVEREFITPNYPSAEAVRAIFQPTRGSVPD